MGLKQELELVEEEILMLTKLLLPVVVVSMMLGVVSCYVSGGGCYRTLPYIYGFIGLFGTALFYYLSPYIDTFRTGVVSGELDIFYEHVGNGYRDLRSNVSGRIDSFLDRLMTEEEEEFEEYSYRSE